MIRYIFAYSVTNCRFFFTANFNSQQTVYISFRNWLSLSIGNFTPGPHHYGQSLLQWWKLPHLCRFLVCYIHRGSPFFWYLPDLQLW